ncbi:MAG: hypothetical protein ACT4R6_10910 [Gemmatimonadaceae bacterium]
MCAVWAGGSLGAQVAPQRTQVRCAGQPISDISVRTQAPRYGGLFARVPALGGIMEGLHRTTEPDVVRDFVLLTRGEPCSPLKRYETERILRAQPFLAAANVTAYDDGAQGVRVEVVTVDEPSVVASLGVQSEGPYLDRLTLGSGNLGGQGLYAAASWRDGEGLRDYIAARYGNYQLWSHAYQMHLAGVRRERGSEWSASLVLPFLSDVQSAGWRIMASRNIDFVPFRRSGAADLAVMTDRTFGEGGAMVRFGRPGRLALVGLSTTVERARSATSPVVLVDSGTMPDTTAALSGRFETYRAARINALLGLRALRFLRVTGFDALSGEQDVRTGVQLAITLGRSIPFDRQWDDDYYGAAGLYLGAGGRNRFAALEAGAEGRRAIAEDHWSAVYGGGRASLYLRPHGRHTVITSAEWTAGYRTRLPFRLSLADRTGGVPGFAHSRAGGGRRLVVRGEERWRLGDIRGTADLAVSAFAEAGKLWAGDVALGNTTSWRPAVGFALLTAVPPRSRRLWRVELALPLVKTDRASPELRFTSGDATRQFWVEPFDLRRNRRRAVLGDLFNWP